MMRMLPSLAVLLCEVAAEIVASIFSGDNVYMFPLRGSTMNHPIIDPKTRFPARYQPFAEAVIGIVCD